ncbi:glutaredoxin [Russula dissimulans]|nr:glutaredoxin [Russula dissimulans]
MSSPKEIVDNAVAGNTVVVFSKSWCPYCKRAKELLAKDYHDLQTAIFELDQRDDGSDIQDYLLEKTGQRTVPNVFINQNHVGGSDALATLHKEHKIRTLL